MGSPARPAPVSPPTAAAPPSASAEEPAGSRDASPASGKKQNLSTERQAQLARMEEEREKMERERKEEKDRLRAEERAKRAAAERERLSMSLEPALMALLGRLDLKDDLTLLLPHIGVQTLEELLRIQLPALPERLEKSPPLSDVDELKRRTVPELVELCSRAVNAARCDVSLEVVRKLKLPDDDIIEWPKQQPATSRSKDDGGQAVHGFKEEVPKPKVSDGPLRKRLYFVTKLWHEYLSSADGAALAARLAADAMDSPSWTETAAWATWMLTSQCHYDDGSGAARREMIEEHLRVTREQLWFALYPAIESRHTGGGWRTYWLRVNNHVTGFFSEKAITRRSQIAAAEARARHVRKSAAEQEAAATRAADAVFRQARASTSPPTKHHHATRTPRTGSSLSTSSGYSSSSSPDLTRLAASPLKDRLRASPTFRALAVATTASQTSSSCSPTSSRIGGIGIGGGAPESPTRSRSAAPAMRRSLLTAQKEGSTVGFSSVAVEAVKRRRELGR